MSKKERVRKPLTKEQRERAREASKRYNDLNREKRHASWKRYDDSRKEKKAAASKAHREANPELYRERRKKIYWGNREYIIAKRKAWGEENKDHCKEYRKRHDAENREQVREMKRKWNDANRDKVLASQRARQENNREHLREQFKKWFKAHQESFEELKRGKAPRRAAILQKWQLCGEVCYICGLHLDRVGMEMDHVIPRAVGGTNDIENLMPTHQTCNRRKNKRLDYPILRPDLVALATVIKSAPRMIRRQVKLSEAA